jgi:hypothetical protein
MADDTCSHLNALPEAPRMRRVCQKRRKLGPPANLSNVRCDPLLPQLRGRILLIRKDGHGNRDGDTLDAEKRAFVPSRGGP